MALGFWGSESRCFREHGWINAEPSTIWKNVLLSVSDPIDSMSREN